MKLLNASTKTDIVKQHLCRSPVLDSAKTFSCVTDSENDELEPGELLLPHPPVKTRHSHCLYCGIECSHAHSPVLKYKHHFFQCVHDCVSDSNSSKRSFSYFPEHNSCHKCKVIVRQDKDSSYLSTLEKCNSQKTDVPESDACDPSAQSCSLLRSVRCNRTSHTPKIYNTVQSHLDNEEKVLINRDTKFEISRKNYNTQDQSVRFPLLRLPVVKNDGRASKARVLSQGTQNCESSAKSYLNSLATLELPIGKVTRAQQYLPPDDKLLALPLLQLPHQVQQPNHYHYRNKGIQYDEPSTGQNTDLQFSFMKKHLSTNVRKKYNNFFFCQEEHRFLVSLGNKHLDVNSNELPNFSLPATKKKSLKTDSLSKSRMEGIEVVREIGRGSYGSVWLVRRSNNQKNLVLKCVELSHCNQQEVEAARQEVLILAGLRHPNIVSYKGSFELDRRLNLLMGYCEGGDLFTRIQQQHGSLFPEQKIIRWFIQITMALQYLHSHNILHRDLKTQNIFLTRSGLIKLGDFGIARILGSSIDMATTMIGTPYYMSPELFAGLPYNYKSDMWALGCCLYELATLKHPFPARDISALINRISRGKVGDVSNHYSEDLQCLVQSLMNRSPGLRPSTSQILLQPSIRNHISVFLDDTTSPVGAKSKGERHKILTGVCKEKKSASVLSGEKTEECLHDRKLCDMRHEKLSGNEKQIEPIKYNLNVKRCCEFFPSQFKSLHIAGDKMKLEDRSKVENKPHGTKECKCKRREKQDSPAVGHIDSQSRRRRRSSKKSPVIDSGDHEKINLLVNSETVFTENSDVDYSLSTPRSYSARERRRQKRLQTTETKSSESTLEHRHLSEKQECIEEQLYVSSSNSRSSTSLASNGVEENLSSDDLDIDSSVDITLTHKYQEEDEFLHLLSTTLMEDSTCDSDESYTNTEAGPDKQDNGSGLEAKMSQLEETLVDELEEDKARSVMHLLRPESWEGWDEQRQAVQQLVGNEVFPSLATTIWHLKLCYTFKQH
ncbi:serine/threonine-protein kinase ppk1-like isoform X2 [Homarus americanus]|uniref:serine/threonine-protein kinase ppk1-like isoform X2 n=1 Tax=Homarus americanus TaxID=6706 RepID=UPI001C44FA9B|nr:serine/threonine-protein kinase ppk1-like isoform X2 [Homarus americanus]